MFQNTETERITAQLSAAAPMELEQILAARIDEWLRSDKRAWMLTGERYYRNQTDIYEKRREIAGRMLKNRSNQQLAHPFIRKLTDQKTGYLLGKMPSILTENQSLKSELQDIFDRNFWRIFKNLGKEAITKGVAWLQVYFAGGKIAFQKIPSEEIIPLWEDAFCERLEGLLRVYTEEAYEGRRKTTVVHAEYWSSNGMDAYIYQGGKLFPDASQTHFLLGGQPRNWGRIPFIPFRYNEEEQPLVNLIKSLVDNYDLQASIYADMLADLPQFIYKLVNYGGQDLEMFLRELQEYRVVSLDENGDVDKLQADPNTAAVEGMLSQARRDIYEFGRGVDSQNEQLGNASGTALKFRYADLDMDCNILETEFQKSFEELLWFVKQYLFFTGKGNYLDEKVELILNRDILIAESEAIANCKESVGIIPDAVIAANHPWM